jgi:hypothetical protein
MTVVRSLHKVGTMSATTTSAREIAARLAEQGIAAAAAYGRADLVQRMQLLGERASVSIARVLVVGEFKQGKTSLVNALVDAELCPSAADAATIVPVGVGWGAQPAATAVVATADGVESRPIDVDSLREWVVEHGAHTEGNGVRGVEVAFPAESLRQGLVFVDFPGVGGLGSFAGVLALAALPSADAVLMVSDAAQELTVTEFDLVQRLATGGVPLALVKTRIDLHPEWRRVLAADMARVASVVSASFAVSSELSAKGRESADAELVEESGIPRLLAWLAGDIVGGVDHRRAVRVSEQVEDLARTLEGPFEAERATLRSPEDAAARARELEHAQAEASRLRSAAGRWQQVLVDTFADLSGDVDHELRATIRDALAAAELAIDELDPAKDWAQYEPELRRTIAGLVADHYEALQLRVTAAATRVASVFSDDSGTVEGLVQDACRDGIARDGPTIDDPIAIGDVRRASIAGQALVMLRSSYGGALMTGFIGGVIGLAVATPAVLAVGAALGAKGLREDNTRRLAQRRAAAKTAVRKLVDGVLFEVEKDSRDSVRLAQRQLRDFFVGQAEELALSASAALRAVQAASDQDAATRADRLRDIEAELGRLSELGERCRAVRALLEEATVEP